MSGPRYTIVIPAYNESTRISESLDQLLDHMFREGLHAEVLVVNDGSSDHTGDIVREYARRHECVRLLDNQENRGKGYAVRQGMLEAQGDVLLFRDADLSFPVGETEKLLRAIEGGADVAIASRWLDPNSQLKREPLFRQWLGRSFNLFLRAVLGLRFKDTQCGFKAFTRDAAFALFPYQNIEGWGFDPEILLLAEKQGLTVAEVPVKVVHSEGSKLNPIRDGLKMLREIMKIRWNLTAGKYPLPHGALPLVASTRGKSAMRAAAASGGGLQDAQLSPIPARVMATSRTLSDAA